MQQHFGLGRMPGGHHQRTQHAVAVRSRRERRDLGSVLRRARRVTVPQHPGDGLQQPALPVGGCRALPRGLDQARRRRGPRLTLGLASREGLEVDGEVLLGQHRGGDAVSQCRCGVTDQRRRGGVQCAAARDAEGVVHGRPHEGMRERHGQRRPGTGLGQQPRRDRLVERRQRSIQLGQRRHLRQRAVHAEHRRGVDEPARGHRARVPAVTDEKSERPGGGQRALPGAPLHRRELGQQRTRVQRVALRAVMEAPRRQ